MHIRVGPSSGHGEYQLFNAIKTFIFREVCGQPSLWDYTNLLIKNPAQVRALFQAYADRMEVVGHDTDAS